MPTLKLAWLLIEKSFSVGEPFSADEDTRSCWRDWLSRKSGRPSAPDLARTPEPVVRALDMGVDESPNEVDPKAAGADAGVVGGDGGDTFPWVRAGWSDGCACGRRRR